MSEETTATVTPSPFMRLFASLALLTTEQARRVNDLQAKAVGYVWGWIDRPGGGEDDSWEFSIHYALMAAAFEGGQTHSLPPIRDAFAVWRAAKTA